MFITTSRSLAALAALGAIITGLFTTTTIADAAPKATPVAPYTAEEVLTAINEVRAEYGLSTLTFDETLNTIAETRVTDMVNRNYFSHTSPDNQPFWTTFITNGYNYLHAGENLAVFYPTVDSLITSWMNSPSHRMNILDTDFKESGIAVARGTYQGYPAWYVAHEFGTEM